MVLLEGHYASGKNNRREHAPQPIWAFDPILVSVVTKQSTNGCLTPNVSVNDVSEICHDVIAFT